MIIVSLLYVHNLHLLRHAYSVIDNSATTATDRGFGDSGLSHIHVASVLIPQIHKLLCFYLSSKWMWCHPQVCILSWASQAWWIFDAHHDDLQICESITCSMAHIDVWGIASDFLDLYQRNDMCYPFLYLFTKFVWSKENSIFWCRHGNCWMESFSRSQIEKQVWGPEIWRSIDLSPCEFWYGSSISNQNRLSLSWKSAKHFVNLQSERAFFKVQRFDCDASWYKHHCRWPPKCTKGSARYVANSTTPLSC